MGEGGQRRERLHLPGRRQTHPHIEWVSGGRRMEHQSRAWIDEVEDSDRGSEVVPPFPVDPSGTRSFPEESLTGMV
jgi:hypothetical protein